MKRSIFFACALSVVMLIGCKKPEVPVRRPCAFYDCKSYVAEFDLIDGKMVGTFEIKAYRDSAEKEYCFSMIFETYERAGVFSSDFNVEAYSKYVELCQKHGDMGYEHQVWRCEEGSAYGYSFIDLDPVSISVVSDADFDDVHPAGTSLDDLFCFNSITPYPFIKRGYQGEELTCLHKRLVDLSAEDMKLSIYWPFMYGNRVTDDRFITPYLSLSNDVCPGSDKKHTFTVTINDDYGRTFTGKVTVDFAVDSADDAVE